MNQDENLENQGDRPEEPAASPAPGENPGASQEPRRHDPRRGRFRRGGRGRRGRGGTGGGAREPRAERPADRPPDSDAPLPPAEERAERPQKSPGTVRDLIDDVFHIQADLEKALDDLNEVLRTLEQAEREKTASER